MTVKTLDKLAKRKLTRQDRCDRCSAQAIMIASSGEKELFFCNHHGNKSREALLKANWSIQDGLTID